MAFTMYGVLTILFCISFMWYTDKVLVRWMLAATGLIGVVSVVFSYGLGMWKYLLAALVIYLAVSVRERRLMNTIILCIWLLSGGIVGIMLLNSLGVQGEHLMIYIIMGASLAIGLLTSFLMGLNSRFSSVSEQKSIISSVFIVLLSSILVFGLMNINEGLYLDTMKLSASIDIGEIDGYNNLNIALELAIVGMLVWVIYKRLVTKDVWESHEAKRADLRLGIFIASLAGLSIAMMSFSILTAVIVGVACFALVMMRREKLSKKM